MKAAPFLVPTLVPMGDRAIILRFAGTLDKDANGSALAFCERCRKAGIPGVEEVVPNLVSVLIRYDAAKTDFSRLSGELRLLAAVGGTGFARGPLHRLGIRYGGEDGPDLASVAQHLDMDTETFISRHAGKPLDVLAIGFAPGFLYCGMHAPDMVVPRLQSVRRSVPPGSILFAAGQTAIAATSVPTGWPLIGRTDMINFDPLATPVVSILAGDSVLFERL